MTPGMRQHRAMVLTAKYHRRQFMVIVRGFREMLLSEMAKDNYERQQVRKVK